MEGERNPNPNPNPDCRSMEIETRELHVREESLKSEIKKVKGRFLIGALKDACLKWPLVKELRQWRLATVRAGTLQSRQNCDVLRL